MRRGVAITACAAAATDSNSERPTIIAINSLETKILTPQEREICNINQILTVTVSSPGDIRNIR